MNHSHASSGPLPFLDGGGETGALMRAINWADHPLGLPETWHVSLRTTVGLILRSRQPMFVSWGPDHHTIYNDTYAQICGGRHPAALAAPLEAIWPELWDTLQALVARVYQGESIHMDDIELLMFRHGYAEETHFSFSYNPLSDDAGNVLGVFCVCAETTEQVMLKRELEHQRVQLSQIFAQSPSFIAQLGGPEHVFEIVNPAYLQLVGHRDIIGKPVAVALPEVRSQGYLEMLDSVFRTGTSVHLNSSKVLLQRTPQGPLEDRYVDFVYQPVINSAGNVSGVFVSGVDVTERINATADLRASEQFLRSVLSASTDCIVVLTLDGRVIYMSNGGRQIMEIPEAVEIEEQLLADFWQEPGRTALQQALAAAGRGTSGAFQGFADTFAGNPRYWDVRVTAMLDPAGRPERILVVSRDITYLKRIEEERENLTHELSHRMKNAFSMVQSVIGQTLRKATSVEEGHRVLSGRVRALADAQNILTQSGVGAMPIKDVVNTAVAPHRTSEGRFVITGNASWISGRQGLGLSLALHELATNATKYGALSTAEGHVLIDWQSLPDGAFRFGWQEVDGPPVTLPDRNGFGTVLIEKIVATYFDGSATLEFPTEGVKFVLTGTITPPDDTEAANPY